MHCPFCNFPETKVVDSRLVQNGTQIRRRRFCEKCKERFTTYETAELNIPKVIKTSGLVESFDENKILNGLQKALEKRPVTMSQIREIVERIKNNLRKLGELEIKSSYIGELVIEELKKLDSIAYVRFASVYLNVKDIDAFKKILEHLQNT